jgi:hypothetical protein
MQDPPSAAELVRTVANFLREDLAPQLSGHLAFRMRVALNALELLARQVDLQPASDRAETDRLSQLLGRTGTLEELNRALSAAIAQNDKEPTPEILDHLWRTTLEKLAIDQPGYEAYRRET